MIHILFLSSKDRKLGFTETPNIMFKLPKVNSHYKLTYNKIRMNLLVHSSIYTVHQTHHGGCLLKYPGPQWKHNGNLVSPHTPGPQTLFLPSANSENKPW